MGTRTSYTQGTFSWVDHVSADQEAAKAFYQALFDWEYDDTPVGDGVYYTMAKLGEHRVAAIAPQQQDEVAQGIPPHWNCYVTVDDVDAVGARVNGAGGQLVVPPFDVMESVGRMAVLIDPVGAPLCLWQPKDNIGADLVNAPGALAWNDLGTADPETAQRFYSDLFGWEYESVGPADLDYWTIKNGGRSNGGIRKAPPEIPAFWLPYFAVKDIDTTADIAKGHGGDQHVPRTTTSGDNAFAVFTDPLGAWFALVEGEMDD